MTFDFHPDALDEYHSAAKWYEELRVRLGAEFVPGGRGWHFGDRIRSHTFPAGR
jgi:hypothetical protein